MIYLFTYSWVWALTFAFFLAISTISFKVLAHIKKTKYRNLWEKDERTSTFWMSQERNMWSDLLWHTPFWVEQDNKARIWIIVYRLSSILDLLVWAAPLFYIFMGLFFGWRI